MSVQVCNKNVTGDLYGFCNGVCNGLVRFNNNALHLLLIQHIQPTVHNPSDLCTGYGPERSQVSWLVG